MKSTKKRMGIVAAITSAAIAASLVGGVVFAGAGDSEPMVIKGSTTVNPIVEASEPDILEYVAGHTITGLDIDAQGSSHGFRCLGGDESDLGVGAIPPATDNQPCISMASSPRKQKHWEGAAYTGHHVDRADAVETEICWDAVCMAVHADLYAQLDAANGGSSDDVSISAATVKAIYEEGDDIDDKTWADYGFTGVTEQVVPMSRDLNSGTREAFMGIFDIDDAPLAATMAEVLAQWSIDLQPGNPEMRNEINDYSTPGKIGYLGLGFIDPSGYPNVKALEVEGVYPTETTVTDGSYPATRHLYLYYIDEDARNLTHDKDFDYADIHAYIDYMTGLMGQARVRDQGFIPQYDEAQDTDVDANRISDLWDLLEVDEHWGETGADGWIRADVDNNSSVELWDLLDIDGAWGDTY